jgi:hypothetical protein
MFHFNIGDFYQLAVDPEYSILYNGLVIGNGSLAINFIDHPATPLIYLTGFAARLTYLISGDGGYINDFISDPEKYLHVASILNTCLIAFIAYWGGKKIVHYTTSIPIAIVFQLLLFTNSSIIEICSRVIPESTMLIPIILMGVLSLKYIYSNKESINKNRLIWQFSALIAFGTACKLSFAPMALFPLILLGSDLKSILRIIGRIILLSCLFAYPLITNISESVEWFSEMLIHSGKHGTGSSNFMETSSITQNIGIILKKDTWFWALFIIQFVLAIVVRSKKVFRVSLALSISLLFILLFTLKHFAIHYIMPFYGFKTLFLILIFLSINEFRFFDNIKTKNRIISATTLLLVCLIIIPQVFVAKGNYNFSIHRKKEAEIKRIKFNSLLPKTDYSLIVDAPYWGTPFKEYGNIYGFMNSYRRKTTFKDQLRITYPNFYCYVTWSKGFNHWDNFVDFSVVFEKNNVAIIYIGPEMKGYETIIKRLNQSGINYELKELFIDNKTNEKLIKVSKLLN